MADKKKTWTEPELIVITRGRPEERVLGVCKNASSSGADVADGACTGMGGDCHLEVSS